MAAILLDTSVIINHLDARYGRTAYLDQLLEEQEAFADVLAHGRERPVAGLGHVGAFRNTGGGRAGTIPNSVPSKAVRACELSEG